ncbi:MAG: hypothetical protein M1828_007134 [Chrysothrix sp. TS-e1954]|nr:MAG: hypothetical protein M1828_007134 [Chrysothrix sp. TS-e1954]
MLHSQNNELAEEPQSIGEDDRIYTKNPFPRLPSQVLAPTGTTPLIYEDANPGVLPTSPAGSVIPRKPVQRRSQIPTPYARQKRNGRANIGGIKTSFRSELGPAVPPVALSPPKSAKSAAPLIDFWERQSTASRTQTPSPHSRGSSSKGQRERIRSPTLSSDTSTTPGVQAYDEIIESLTPEEGPSDDVGGQKDPATVVESQDVTSEPPKTTAKSPSDRLEESVSLKRPITPDHPRTDFSSSDQHYVQGENSTGEMPTTGSDVRSEALDAEHQRPRSASAPPAPTDAFLQALTSNDAQAQYPLLRQTSITSFSTETSSIRTAFPPPLRLHRAPGILNLAGAASWSGLNARHQASMRSRGTNGSRLRQEDIAQSQFVSDQHEDYNTIYQPSGNAHIRVSGRWTEELRDTVTELYSHSLRPQRSLIHRRSSSDTRPSSQNSVMSTGGFFYHFLNDSYTAWAHAYYRGDGKLRLETPPVVTEVRLPSTPEGPASASSASGPSNSPESVGYIEAIYVPRARPLRGQQQQQRQHSLSIRRVPSERDMELHPQDTQRNLAVEAREEVPQATARPKAATPHLTKEREARHSLPDWRAPSIEEGKGIFDDVNRQIALFCLGFVFPFGK